MRWDLIPKCSKCGYRRNPVDKGPPEKCIRCGSAIDISAALESEVRLAQESAARAAALADERARLAEIASRGELTFRESLARYVSLSVAVNLTDPVKLESVILESAQRDHFVVKTRNGFTHRLPYMQILRVVEAENSSLLKAGVFSEPVHAIVEMFHLVVYKGSMGVGFGLSE